MMIDDSLNDYKKILGDVKVMFEAVFTMKEEELNSQDRASIKEITTTLIIQSQKKNPDSIKVDNIGEPASEKQIKFLKDLKAEIPEGLTKQDAISLIEKCKKK